MMDKWSRTVAFFLVVIFFIGIPLPVQAAGFTDLQGHWVEAKVNDLVAAGIISPGEKYRPRDPVTRADFVKMLVVASGLPHAVSYPPTFSDVRQDHWFYKYVETAVYHGVVKGDATGRFRPHEGLTREQMASLVIRALKDETDASTSFLTRFKDGGQTSKWAEADLARAIARGLISGTDQGFLFPTQAATRDQAAAVIWELWKLKETGDQSTTLPTPTDTLSAVAKARSLNSVVITFNEPVDVASAAQAKRYRLVPATGLQLEIPVEAVQVAADGRSATLSTGRLTKGTRYLLSILDLTAGGKTHTMSLYFTAEDVADEVEPPVLSPTPTNENIVLLGPNRLKVTFDQELNPNSVSAGPEGNFTLVHAGTAFSPGIITEAIVTGPCEVTLTVPQLKEGSRYTLNAHDLTDLFGNKISKDPLSFSFTVRANKQAPRLVAAECTGRESLELTFDQELDEKSAGSVNSYRLRETGERPQSAWVSGNKAVLVFADQLTVSRSYTLDVEPVANLWGAKSTATSRSVIFNGDTVTPVALSAKALSSTAVEVLFNEKLASIGDITLRRGRRKIDVRQAEQAGPGRVIVNTHLDRDSQYQLELTGALDTAGNKAAEQSLYFTFVSSVDSSINADFPPEVKEVRLVPGRSDQIAIRFSQSVQATSAEKTRNYELTLADDLSETVEIEAAQMGADDKEVLLTLEEPLEMDLTYRYFVSYIEGVNGKEVIPAAGYLVPGSTGIEDSFVQSVTALDVRRVEVIFNEDVQDKYTTSNYGLVDKETGRLISILGVDATSDSDRVILRLGQDLEEDRDYLFSAGNDLTDKTGKRFSTFNTTLRLATAGRRFRLDEATALDNRSFRLSFTRPVQEVRVDFPGYVFSYEYYDSVVVVRANKSFKSGESYRPEVWARDNLGQVLDWRSFKLKFDSSSRTAEVVDVMAATSQRIKVEFSGPLEAYSAEDELNYYLETSSQSILRPVKAEYDPAQLTVWLTMPTTSSLANERYWLVLDGVRDVNGNSLSTKDRYRFYGVDTIPPIVLLPQLVNQEGLPVRVAVNADKVTVEGLPGAVEPEAYVRVYVDGQLVAVGQAEADGSFKPLSIGKLQGRRTLRLVVTDLAGNSGECSQVYEF